MFDVFAYDYNVAASKRILTSEYVYSAASAGYKQNLRGIVTDEVFLRFVYLKISQFRAFMN